MIGLGLPLHQIPGSPGSRRSMPPPARPETDGLSKRQRKSSLKKVLKQSGDMLSSVVGGGQRQSIDSGRPPFLATVGRMGSKNSTSSGEDAWHTPLTTTAQASPASSTSRPSDKSWHEEKADGDIEKRVLEMAGLGLGLSSSTSSSNRRVQSEGVAKLSPGSSIARSQSANEESPIPKVAEVPDMKMLRRIADLPGNDRCADCGKGMKSSRWATLSEL